ncbi:sirohydrochlorin cobaltochelatase [Polaromonas sp. OV174]|uniref:sirohydrochlorin chelatase n=1 Tax=Polaromonas sp. OV174 TaxID=1855300 RepID=UPI0008DFFEAF|nr:CbiX/SirB N-terminal domain-containing protein [Polaromonas sp. OV174]SFC55929.1 sirohydrochlorin cobaltochelatase [Polaromonas sp. OV174]
MTLSPSTLPGIVLLAHGSRDPLWRAPIEAVAARILARQPDAKVCCAYLELCAPSLAEAAANLIADGARPIRIFPLFLGVGKHAREDLPRLVEHIRAAHPGVAIELLPTAGEHEQLTALLADIALS